MAQLTNLTIDPMSTIAVTARLIQFQVGNKSVHNGILAEYEGSRAISRLMKCDVDPRVRQHVRAADHA